MTWKQVMVCAVILGVAAAGVVWFLERFEVAKLHTEMSDYLKKVDGFTEYLKKEGIGGTDSATS